MSLGTEQQPLRVAIIGSGPSGFYAAEHLLKQKDLTVEVDMFDRLPTPFGLVRGGVAPDHQKIKSVVKVYDRTASNPNFRFFGNVNFGSDITHADITEHYHAVIYAVGAQSDKNLDIPGEELSGSHAATEFVAWYNGHPDYRDYQFDLSQEVAVVVGIGNVAMDVTRLLAASEAELRATDMADYAIEAIANSNIKKIYVLGRRGPAQAAFTNPEIKELGEMEEADLIITPDELDLDPLSQAYLESDDADKKDVKNVAIMREYAERGAQGKRKQIIMRFLTSPVEILGDGKVEQVKLVKNELVQRSNGALGPRATDKTEIIDAGLVFRSVGYKGVPLPDVPFYDKWGTIPNDMGRVQKDFGGEFVTGEYVVGWIKRGPSGIIGTNKPDSIETVDSLLSDLQEGKVFSPSTPARDTVLELLQSRNVDFVTYADWKLLDEIETALGLEQNRPRVKFTSIDEMLTAIKKAKAAQPSGD